MNRDEWATAWDQTMREEEGLTESEALLVITVAGDAADAASSVFIKHIAEHLPTSEHQRNLAAFAAGEELHEQLKAIVAVCGGLEAKRQGAFH